MARPQKIGLDYFPVDCNPDKKLKAVIRKFGAEGFGVVIGLYQHIYSEGYFIEYTNDFSEDFALEINVDDQVLDDVLHFCLKRGLFNYNLFKSDRVLTSSGIQKRYLLATERRKCTQINNHNLVNVNNNPIDVNNNKINECRSTQSKVKESKVKKSKEIKPETPSPIKFNPKKLSEGHEWIDNDLWIEWIDHKKKVKASITERALMANIKKLEGFGKDKATANIERALEKNWKDFYLQDDLFSSHKKNEQEGQVLRSSEPITTAPFKGEY